MRADQLTGEYLRRQPDARMIELIERSLRGYSSVLDVACGSGLYGMHLREAVPAVYGIDQDPVLCATATATGSYDRIVCDGVLNAAAHFADVDAIFCSEFLEHVANGTLPFVVAVLEALTRRRLVFTVPNPLSPHFTDDPSHVARYTIYSLRRTLNRSHRFSYSLGPLGLSDAYRDTAWGRWANVLSKRTALLSPTVSYVAERVAPPRI
jgi:SAM-dependent methyltransferase